jgi:hypothetical protein
MKTSMSVLMIKEILNQAGKMTVLPVTGGVRPKLEISRITGTIEQQLHACFLSKNVMFPKNPCILVPFTLEDQSLSAT